MSLAIFNRLRKFSTEFEIFALFLATMVKVVTKIHDQVPSPALPPY